jgi:sugar (pentulose or hexulose) kinase
MRDVLLAAGYPISEARLGGGGSRSALWNGLKADVWNVPVRVAAGAEATALGAALLAGMGVGLYRDLDDATTRAVHPGPTRVPDPTHVRLYDALYGRWLAVKAKCGA